MHERAATCFHDRSLQVRGFRRLVLASFTCALTAATLQGQQAAKLTIHWDKVTTVSKSTPTLQVVVNPPLRPGSPNWSARISGKTTRHFCRNLTSRIRSP